MSVIPYSNITLFQPIPVNISVSVFLSVLRSRIDYNPNALSCHLPNWWNPEEEVVRFGDACQFLLPWQSIIGTCHVNFGIPFPVISKWKWTACARCSVVNPTLQIYSKDQIDAIPFTTVEDFDPLICERLIRDSFEFFREK